MEVVGVGTATINNGAPRPRRRHDSNGSIEIGARHYDVIHHRRRQTELLRDGTLVARFRARWRGRQQVMEDRSVDDIDRCAVGLVLAAMSGRSAWDALQQPGKHPAHGLTVHRGLGKDCVLVKESTSDPAHV